MKVSTDSQQSKSEAVITDHDQEITKERFISSGKRSEIINELRVIY